jgi:hypothetical protein
VPYPGTIRNSRVKEAYGLFSYSACSSGYIVSDTRIINQLGRKDLEESVRSLAEVLYLNLPRRNEENHETQSGYSVSLPRFESARLLANTVAVLTITFRFKFTSIFLNSAAILQPNCVHVSS